MRAGIFPRHDCQAGGTRRAGRGGGACGRHHHVASARVLDALVVLRRRNAAQPARGARDGRGGASRADAGGTTTIRVIFPAWSQNRLMDHLPSAEGWARLRDGFRPLSAFIAEGAQLMWAANPGFAHLEGKFFGEIAESLKLDPVEAYLTI